MAYTTARPSPSDHHPRLTYEHAPGFGDYIYMDSGIGGSWTQTRSFADGRLLLLEGRGRRPTPAQVSLFHEIDARLPDLTAAAVGAVSEPPMNAPSRWFRQPRAFTPSELTLRTVCIEADGSFDLFFDTPTGDAIDMWPIVTFEGWRVTRAEWAC